MRGAPNMLIKKPMILGDWGTTVNRLYLCEWVDNKLHILDRVEGQGTKNNPDPEASFFALADKWLSTYPDMTIYLIGTVGSNIGWKMVDYVHCPADDSLLLSSSLRFTARNSQFVIFPGLSCINQHGLPDSMRGEETQIFGYLANQTLHKPRQIICLPGTHTKWVLVENGIVKIFLTSPIGELYEVLCLHSVLLKSATVKDWDDEGFSQGLTLSKKPTSSLLHTMFATRSQQVIDGYSNPQAAGFLSGLLIGSDIKSAQRSFDEFSQVVLIGSSHVNSLYEQAFRFNDIEVEVISSEWATTQGIIKVASSEWQ